MYITLFNKIDPTKSTGNFLESEFSKPKGKYVTGQKALQKQI